MPNSTEALIKQLESYITEQEHIAGGWNGEDSQYILDGEILHEDDAGTATDRADAAKKLLESLKEYDA